MRAFLDTLRHRRLDRRRAALTYPAARRRAAAGARLLDDQDPGWAARVDPGRLELADGQACVLGQLWGEYRRGLGRGRVLDLSSAPTRFVSPVDLGFQATPGLGEAAEALDYAHLTRAWRALVRSRRQPEAPRPTARPQVSA